MLKDAPRHSELRKLMNRGFTPAATEALGPRVEAIIGRLLEQIEGGTFDLIKDFAYPLPVRVICELLGLSAELHDRCVTLSDDIALWMGDPRRPADLARAAQRAVCELAGYFADTIHLRSGVRKNDLLDLLLDGAGGGEGMSEEELHAQCVMLLFAGHETTRNLIGNGIYTLLKHPAACAELRNDEAALPAAIEELLRYESPILAFGGDAHICLGSTLARLEGRLSIGALIRRFPALRLADERPEWGRNFAFRGLNTLRVLT